MRKFRFYKDELGWFIDLKWFPFGKHWLAMVAGADKLLDNIAKGKTEVTLQVSESPIPFYDGLIKKSVTLGLFKGAIYGEEPPYLPTRRELVKALWLCPVTVWLFWYYPKKIYFKIV